ncbi:MULTISPECIES: hypothetical protein [Actinomadura]|uniref:hypothetical protein n=1 Tax=Actinomadura TaxID=1988 RepID=UPI000F76B714|nr:MULTISPECIES: hypothetical protein [Actinomadura]
MTFDTRERPERCPRARFRRGARRPADAPVSPPDDRRMVSLVRAVTISRPAGYGDVGGRDVQSFAVSSECLGLEKSQ